jgi:putative ABC transport system ATP-binding protein
LPIIELHQVDRSYRLHGSAAPSSSSPSDEAPRPSSGAVIEASYTVLRGLELSVESGELVAIVGPSGSGKSTLLQLVGGLDRADRGSVRVAGQDLGTASPHQLDLHRRSTVGFVFQAFHLNPRRTALDNVLLPLVFAPLDGVDERAWGLELLGRVGLAGFEHRLASQLSGGQRQRVAIARALVRKPRILLADEPVGNLDADTGRDIVALLSRLNRELGLTIVAVCHDHMLLEAATRTLYLRDGVLCEAGADTVAVRRVQLPFAAPKSSAGSAAPDPGLPQTTPSPRGEGPAPDGQAGCSESPRVVAQDDEASRR